VDGTVRDAIEDDRRVRQYELTRSGTYERYQVEQKFVRLRGRSQI
jgi:hypothetical protein